jgi:hypothetical protein
MVQPNATGRYLTVIDLPYPMFLIGFLPKKVTRISCHKMVDKLIAILNFAVYGIEK